MHYALAIFDLDGTILDTLEDLKCSLNYALSQHGYPVRTLEETRAFVGNGIRKLMERAVPEGTTTQCIDQVHATFTKHYKVHCADHTKPYDHILDVLQALRAAGVRTAVVSNKADYAVQELCHQYFEGLFDSVAGEKAGILRKPAPDSVNYVLEDLSISRAQAVYIGDSEVDIATARNAGMDMLIVDWGFRDADYLKSQGASTLISHPEDLLTHIL